MITFVKNLDIQIGSLEIDTVGNCSVVNVGKNFLDDFAGLSKENQGLGNIYGNKNSFASNTNYVEDADLADCLVVQQQVASEEV